MSNSMFPPKTRDCLVLASLPPGSAEWQHHYAAICDRWGEKAVCTKMVSLAARDYIDYGVSARSGWLTVKGKAALQAVEQGPR